MDPSILTRPLRPLPEAPRGRDEALDGLRALCALTVFFGHILARGALGPDLAPVLGWERLNFGFAGVLMFFVISGYAIGLSTRAPANGAEIKVYLGRRFWRLVPVNTAAVLLSWLVLPTLAWDAVAGNLFFLQNREVSYFGWAVPLLPVNTNLWTLNFEVIYYLGFIALWRWMWRAGTVAAGVIAVVLAGVMFPGFPPAVARYACGALYWLAGLWVAWQTPAPAGEERTRWPSALLAAVALWSAAPLRGVFYVLGWDAGLWPTPVSPHRLDFLAGCIWVLLAVTGRGLAGQRRLAFFCLGWPAAYLLVRVAAGPVGDGEIFAGTTLALAAVLWWWRPAPVLLRRLAPVGAISYGIYALGSPFQFGLRRHWPLAPGSLPGLLSRVAVLIVLTFGLAWLLERQLQPWLRRRFVARG